MTGKGLGGIVPSHLPLQSSVAIRVGMFASPPWHLGNVLGCYETPAAHAVTLVIVTLGKTCVAQHSVFSFGVGFLNASFLGSLLI